MFHVSVTGLKVAHRNIFFKPKYVGSVEFMEAHERKKDIFQKNQFGIECA